MTEDIWVGGNVTIYNNAVNTKNLYSGGAVNIKGNGQVSGNIQAVGDVTLYNNAAVGGEIRSMGNVTLNKAYVGGDVWANGSVFNDKLMWVEIFIPINPWTCALLFPPFQS